MQNYDAILVDAGTGNLHSVYNALLTLGFSIKLSKDPHDLQTAGRIILPGVGAFGGFMEGLESTCDLIPAIQEAATRGTPMFGICVGMQALFAYSTEMGQHPGLESTAPGKVIRFDDTPGFKIPHTGWNQLWFGENPSPLFQGSAGWQPCLFQSCLVLPTRRGCRNRRPNRLSDRFHIRCPERQHRGRPVPPRKKPASRPANITKFLYTLTSSPSRQAGGGRGRARKDPPHAFKLHHLPCHRPAQRSGRAPQRRRSQSPDQLRQRPCRCCHTLAGCRCPIPARRQPRRRI